jgi:hypothetical protein
MAISVGTIFAILNYAIPAIKTAEQFIRGRGKGKDKRKAVIDSTIDHLSEVVLKDQSVLPNIDLPNFRDYKWLQLALNTTELREKIGVVVDAVVDLVNFLGSFDNDPNIPPS